MGELLDARRYGKALLAIEKAEQNFLERGDAAGAKMLAAAGQLCRVCRQVRAERARHNQEALEARSHERELRRELRSIIESISRLGQSIALGRTEEPPPAEPMVEEERASLVQRLSGWLEGLRPPATPQLPEGVEDKTGSIPEEGDIEGLVPATVPEVALNAADRELLLSIHDLLLSTRERLTIPGFTAGEEEADARQLAPQVTEKPALPLVPDTAVEPLLATTRMAALERGDPQRADVPLMMVYTLGPFRVIHNDQPVVEWYGSKGKAIFKYLISRPEQSVAKEVLMELFWPGADPDAARNNLNVAIYSMRKALRNTDVEFSHILYQEDRYLLNPQMELWLDFVTFSELFREAADFEQRGQVQEAISSLHAAELLYQGEFLTEDRYEDWLIPQRQRLRDMYMSLLERLSRYYFEAEAYSMSVTYCRQMLVADSCHEEAHRRLMRCYYRQGQLFLAIRQYHQCVEVLRNELDLEPSAETEQLLRKIQRNEPL